MLQLHNLALVDHAYVKAHGASEKWRVYVASNQSFARAKHLSAGMINSDKFWASGSSWNPGTSMVPQVGVVLTEH